LTRAAVDLNRTSAAATSTGAVNEKDPDRSSNRRRRTSAGVRHLGCRRTDCFLMFDRDTQFKIMLTSLLFSTIVACVCLYAKPQQQGYAVVKADKVRFATK
jgi:hypothetical protein